MLEISDLNVYYGESHVVRDVTFRVPEGRLVCLMGRNGVGKTTTLKALMGLLPAKRGRIRFRGEEITRLPPFARARMGIGYVPQGREIIPGLTVEENLRIGLEGARAGAGVVPDHLFKMFPALASMLKRRGGDLSGGQQQQLAIARALASGPSLLILDEPTEGIQPSIIQEIISVIRGLKAERKMTILLVEQYLAFVREAADFFCVLEKGAVAAEGPIEALTDEIVKNHLTV